MYTARHRPRSHTHTHTHTPVPSDVSRLQGRPVNRKGHHLLLAELVVSHGETYLRATRARRQTRYEMVGVPLIRYVSRVHLTGHYENVVPPLYSNVASLFVPSVIVCPQVRSRTWPCRKWKGPRPGTWRKNTTVSLIFRRSNDTSFIVHTSFEMDRGRGEIISFSYWPLLSPLYTVFFRRDERLRSLLTPAKPFYVQNACRPAA